MVIYYKRLIIFFAVFICLAIAYVIFKESIHLWFCENENNGASCSIIGMIHHEHKEMERAEKYLKKSCDMGYGLGCFKLALFHKENKSIDSKRKTHEYLSKACVLEYESACLMMKDKGR